MALHPLLTQNDMVRMTTAELDFFTDAPVAHLTAFEDFRRQQRIDMRNRDVLRAAAARRDSAVRFAGIAFA